MNNESNFFEYAIDGGVVIAFITCMLYISGVSYYYGFLEEWGIGNSLLIKTFHQTMYIGVGAWISFGSSILVYFYITILISLGIISTLIGNDSYRFTIIKKFVMCKRYLGLNKNMSRSKYSKTTVLFNKVFKFGSLFCLVMAMFLLILSFFHHQGVAHAADVKEQILAVDSKSAVDSKLVSHILLDDNDNEIIIIDCSDSLCAVANIKTRDVSFLDITEQKHVRLKEKIKI